MIIILQLSESAGIYIPKTAMPIGISTRGIPTIKLAEHWFSWLQANMDYDQLIMVTSNGRDFWIHISCRKIMSKNRHQIIRYMKK